MTAFLYLVMVRDYIYEHLAALTGARVTLQLRPDRRPGARSARRLARAPRRDPRPVRGVRRPRSTALVDRNRIFIDRTRDVGVISTADALNFGFTGPILRSTGAPRDLRKDTPYLAYAELDFDVPVGIKGDNYDRYFVRMREMDESVYMIRQLARDAARRADQRRRPPLHVPGQAARLQGDRVADQPLQAGHGRPRVPAGEVYCAHEAPNGELGFYLVSTGGGTPYKVHVRSPSFVHMGGVPHARRLPARRHRADLRLDQHDRRGVRRRR